MKGPSAPNCNECDCLIPAQALATPTNFQYDAAGRRTFLTLPNGVSTEYQYDAASRLTALLYRTGQTPLGDLQYGYDAAGNRIFVGGAFARALLPDPAATTTYDAGNRQLTFGDQTFTFDDAGNRLTQTDPSGTITSTWDARHRLTALTGPGLAASFAYDGLGRRAQKTVNGVPTDVGYDGLDTVTETSGGTEVAYLRTLAIDEALVRTDAVAPVFYLGDALGSTVALADGSGTLATAYSYTPFGRSAVTGTPSSNPVQFTGRENDGTGLYYYRARYYDPVRSRFVHEDPIGLAGGDVNFYAYVSNGPISWRDTTGLSRDTYNPDAYKHGGPHIDRYNRAGQNVGRYRPDGTPLTKTTPAIPKSDLSKFAKAVEKLNNILGKHGGKLLGFGIGVVLDILMDAEPANAAEEEMLECVRLGGRKSECLQK